MKKIDFNVDTFNEDNSNKLNSENSNKICKYFSRKCSRIFDVKDKSVYIETLTVASTKRTIKRFYTKLFKNRSSGYEQLMTDEERRLNNKLEYISVVEGI